MTDTHTKTSGQVIEAAARFTRRESAEKPAAPAQVLQPNFRPHIWTEAEVRSLYYPAVKALPFIVRKDGASLVDHPLSFWNDTPGVCHRSDYKRGVAFGEMTIQAIAEDDCRHFPLLNVFNAIVADALKRRVKGGKHSRTLPPAVDGFLVSLSKFIASAARNTEPSHDR